MIDPIKQPDFDVESGVDDHHATAATPSGATPSAATSATPSTAADFLSRVTYLEEVSRIAALNNE